MSDCDKSSKPSCESSVLFLTGLDDIAKAIFSILFVMRVVPRAERSPKMSSPVFKLLVPWLTDGGLGQVISFLAAVRDRQHLTIFTELEAKLNTILFTNCTVTLEWLKFGKNLVIFKF